MFDHDDRYSAKLVDRLIAGAIGGICGYWIGFVFALIFYAMIGSRFGTQWIIAAVSAVCAFAAPARAQALWSRVWREISGAFGTPY